jgi:hypothetical protein
MTAVVSKRVQHGDRIDLPKDPTVEVAVQPSGAAVDTFVYAFGSEPLDSYTVELADIDGSGEVDIDGDLVDVCGVNYQRMVAVTFTKDG